MATESTISAPPADPRRHDLDALRASAMLLGIGLHAALSFMDIPWVVQDRNRAPYFADAVAAVHGFRMPLFFLLSGFFTAMLWRKRGLSGLLWHRAKRIAIPLGLGCATIVPLMWVVIVWAAMTQPTPAPVDPAQDLWAAAVSGDLDAVRAHVANGAELDAPDPNLLTSPLGWAVFGDQTDAVELLLESGADAAATYGDDNTALHTAAFFGRAEAAELLLDAGADPLARNAHGETPMDSTRHGKGMTEFIAGIVNVSVEFEAVSAGRDIIRPMLESRIAATTSAAVDSERPAWGAREILGVIVAMLVQFPFFHHLWFLWFLCWLVSGFALVVAVSRVLPRMRVPAVLIGTPLCLLWLVPLTLLTLLLQTGDVAGLTFGADTSAGLIPMPHVLAHYAVFFAFGAILYGIPGAADRLGRVWWLQLPLALALFPVALGLTTQASWASELVADESTLRVLAKLAQAIYVWLMIFGLMGLFETVLGRERPWVRYVSDSSYWLYLVHLPLILVGQALLREADMPALAKFALLVAISTAILLVSYHWLVRYSWVGRLLNGPRVRPATTAVGTAEGIERTG